MIEKLVEEIRSGRIKSREQLERVKTKLSRNGNVPPNSEIIKRLSPEERKEYAHLLIKKPVRSLSGVVNVTVMTKPGPCPHGVCYYCPIVPGIPWSYTGNEPASMRGKRRNWDPYLQVQDRLKQFYSIGHTPNKIELVVNGGTFLNHDSEYKEWFIRRLYQALNDYPEQRGDVTTLRQAQRINETSEHRAVALVLETRPDSFNSLEVLNYGCTRIEFGVQNLDDEILKRVNRGHGVEQTKRATEQAKNAGLKVDYHMMLGLPGATVDSDVEMFYELFENPEYRPDGLKVYPTLILKQTVMYKWYKRGEYEPINDEYVFEVLKKVKPMIPRYVRIKRIMRDIPLTLTQGNLRKGNIRELVRREVRCNCIRCREVGHKELVKPLKLELNVQKYEASNGIEYFISFDDVSNDALIGFSRLRVAGGDAWLRELHVYGYQLRVGERSAEYFQHKGFGEKLLVKTEELTQEEGVRELKVMSGVGARKYYEKHGYELEHPFMVKRF